MIIVFSISVYRQNYNTKKNDQKYCKRLRNTVKCGINISVRGRSLVLLNCTTEMNGGSVHFKVSAEKAERKQGFEVSLPSSSNLAGKRNVDRGTISPLNGEA